MLFAARLGFVALTFAAWAAASAAEHKMRGVTIEKPAAGWEEKATASGIIFTRTFEVKGRKGRAVMAVESRPFAGDLNTALDDAVTALDRLKNDKPGTAREGVTTSGHKMAWRRYCCRSKDGTRMQMTMVAFNTPGTLVTAYLIEINLRDRDSANELQGQFAAMVVSFDFAGEGRRPALPAVAPGEEALEGLYLNVSSTLRPNPMGGTDYVVDMNTYYFAPSGLLADQPPAVAGTDGLVAFCEETPDACGVYRREGDEIVLRTVSSRFGMVVEERESFAREDAALVIDRVRYNPVPPLSETRLDGTWTHFSGSSGSTGTASGAVATVRTVSLSRDGTFRRSGFSAVTSTVETGGTTTGVAGSSETPEQRGTYRIDGYALILDVEDGEPETLSIYAPGDKRDLLVINGVNYLRKDKD